VVVSSALYNVRFVQCRQWRRYRGGARGAAAPSDSRFVKYGALVHQVVNIYMHNLQNYANILYFQFTSR